LRYARQRQSSFLEGLREYLRIPSISTDPDYGADVRRAAAWLAGEMGRLGLKEVMVIETGGHPAVYGSWLGAGPEAPTVLLYGHYDVQPVDPVQDWALPPFAAAIRAGRVYARGASDNKAQHFSHLKAIESLLATAGKLPLNVKLLIDGEEEVGSANLERLVAGEAELLAADMLIVSDGAMIGEDQPSVEYALRGIVTLEVRVTGPSRDLHSGSYGGSVHNPAQAAAELIAGLHDETGRVAVPGFYDDVVPPNEDERALLANLPYSEAQWRSETGAPAPWGEPAFSLIERMTARPTLEVNGLFGGYAGPGVKTIIPAVAGFKISARLVPDQDPARVADLIADHLKRAAPTTVGVTVAADFGARAAYSSHAGPAVQAALRATERAWGKRPVLSRAGGSLPVVAVMQKVLGVPFVVLPLGLDDNRHSPNEHYRLDYFARGIETAIHLYFELAAAWRER
jgi:acetylornithine deacetylase/succinyl-diaminopimelate desuccinylase-like protein